MQVNKPGTSEVSWHVTVDSFQRDGRGIYLLYHSFFQSMAPVNCLELNLFS